MARRHRIGLTLLALLALFFQALQLQTHVHPAAGAVGAPAGASAAALHPSRHDPRAPAPLDCPSCRQLAQTGAFLLPTPPLHPVRLAFAAWRSAMPTPVTGAGRGRSHAWFGRGPPALSA